MPEHEYPFCEFRQMTISNMDRCVACINTHQDKCDLTYFAHIMNDFHAADQEELLENKHE